MFCRRGLESFLESNRDKFSLVWHPNVSFVHHNDPRRNQIASRGWDRELLSRGRHVTRTYTWASTRKADCLEAFSRNPTDGILRGDANLFFCESKGPMVLVDN